MDHQADFKELLELFVAQEVEFIVVGAYALAFHGVPRYTGDLDLFVRPTPENARRIISALGEFGFGGVGLSERDFSEPDTVIQLGFPPVRIDLITSLSGVVWDEAVNGSVRGDYGGVSVRFIGRTQLIANKRACGRKKDLADIEALGED